MNSSPELNHIVTITSFEQISLPLNQKIKYICVHTKGHVFYMICIYCYVLYADTPKQPTGITISQRTCDSVMVQWDKVINMFPITYEVTWSGGNGDNGSATTNHSSYTINGLTYDTSYNVTVAAINTCCGAGPSSNIILTTNSTLALVTVEPTATLTITMPPIGEYYLIAHCV